MPICNIIRKCASVIVRFIIYEQNRKLGYNANTQSLKYEIGEKQNLSIKSWELDSGFALSKTWIEL